MPRFSCMVDAEPLPVHDSMVGIHVGLESFAVTSDGGNHETTRVVIGGHKGNRAESNVMCLAVSNVFRAGARPVGSPPSCTAMCSHQRNDFQHKLSRELVNHYGRIAVEDFNVQGLAGGTASITFISIYTHFLAEKREADAQKTFSVIITVMTTVFLIGILAAEIFTPQFVGWMFHGFSDDQMKLCVSLTRILLPAQIFFYVGGVVSAVLLSHRMFLFPSFGPLLYNVFIILGGVVAGKQ